jgi:hypothetical protein
MIKQLMYILLSLAMAITLIGAPSATHYDPITAEDRNLLSNGDFEGVFIEYPKGGGGKDYIAEGWSRWWIHGTSIPEFSDAIWGRDPYQGNHAQIYHSWPKYTAGVYQVITDVLTCRPYELTMYTKTNAGYSTSPNSRIGIDPEGITFTEDGAVKNGLPPKTVWSEEQQKLFEWEELSVKAEPITSQINAILYAAPRPNPYYETSWDTGALVPSTYDDGRMPEPSGISNFIRNISTVTGTTSITISWQTTEPAASTQVWYHVFTPSTPVTPTATMTHTVHLPLISQGEETFDLATGISFMRATEHQALINGLGPGKGIKFIILVRRLNGDACETVQSEPREVILATNTR